MIFPVTLKKYVASVSAHQCVFSSYLPHSDTAQTLLRFASPPCTLLWSSLRLLLGPARSPLLPLLRTVWPDTAASSLRTGKLVPCPPPWRPLCLGSPRAELRCGLTSKGKNLSLSFMGLISIPHPPGTPVERLILLPGGFKAQRARVSCLRSHSKLETQLHPVLYW